MSRFSPLRYLCILAFSIVGSWVLLVLTFLFLPAFPYDWDLEPQLVQRKATTLTRVYTVDDWYPFYESKSSVQDFRDVDREFFALDYEISSSPYVGKTFLVLGGQTSLDLHAYWDRIEKKPRDFTQGPAYYISEPIQVPVKLGDRDGINPPWFRQADACLLFWEIHRETGLLPLRLKATDTQTGSQTIEIWPDSDSWSNNNDPSMRAKEPLATFYSDDEFGSIDVQFPYADEVEHTSPSRTFALRRVIQSVILFIGFAVYSHSGFMAIGLVAIIWAIDFVVKLVAFYAVLVFVVWVVKGGPEFSPWVQSYWLTRHTIARLPRLNQDSTVWDHAPSTCPDSVTRERQPQALRGIGDFFRSRSPLDDLFVTFEYTKYMVEPIRFRRQRTNSGERAQVTGVPNDFKFNVAHRPHNDGRSNQQEQQLDLEKGQIPMHSHWHR